MILKPNIHEEKKVHQTKKDKPQSTRSHQQKPSSYKKPLWFMMLSKPRPCKLNKDCIFVLQTSMEHEFPCCLNKLFRNALLTASCYCRQHKNTFLLTNEPLKDSFLWQIWSWEVKKKYAWIPRLHAVTQHDLHWLAGQNANLVWLYSVQMNHL